MVTLNPPVPPAAQHAGQLQYEHPIMDQRAIDAQQALAQIQGQDRIWFAGAWTGYGFHEDGLKSALRIARAFDVAPAWTSLP
jgi:predicted NAD/FAD-binding protein